MPVLVRQLIPLIIIALIAISTSVQLAVRSAPKVAEHRDSPKITTTVDWSATKGTITSLGFGVNAFQGFRSNNFNSRTYQQNMLVMKPGLIRFHNGSALQDSSSPDGLIDAARKSWDVKKVKSALAASVSAFGQQQPQRMINIPTWPDWMDADRDGFLDRSQFDDYARLCADLVKIVNRASHFKVKYWEVTNEKDDLYFTQFHNNGGWGGLKDAAKPDRLNDLIAIYNQAASAMKRVDRNIKVGGPGIARADLQPFYVPFIKGTVDRLDFFTYHFYATGSADTPDKEVFDATSKVGDYTASIVKVLKEASPRRKIPAMLDEYNISWTWETRDPRMTNHKGVVFDALSTIEALSNGAVATLTWNEKDGIYGKMDDQCRLRIGGHLLKLMNQFTIGNYVSTATSDRNIINTFAVRNPRLGYRTYLSINRSNHAQQIQIKFTRWRPTRPNLTLYMLSSSGYIKKTVNWSDVRDNLTMPANSVILLAGLE
jgi:Glycosyl hydrolases family 39